MKEGRRPWGLNDDLDFLRYEGFHAALAGKTLRDVPRLNPACSLLVGLIAVGDSPGRFGRGFSFAVPPVACFLGRFSLDGGSFLGRIRPRFSFSMKLMLCSLRFELSEAGLGWRVEGCDGVRLELLGGRGNPLSPPLTQNPSRHHHPPCCSGWCTPPGTAQRAPSSPPPASRGHSSARTANGTL